VPAAQHLHHDQIAAHPRRGMISSFSQGTEVTRSKTRISLTRVLPHGENVTHWFR
jgi:hypothetical protein